jgi:hypothetical protein
MKQCPVCSSTFVRPERPAWWERLCFRFTTRRVYTCWHCGWRGWLDPDAGAGRRVEDKEDAAGGRPSTRGPAERARREAPAGVKGDRQATRSRLDA